ncbi:hypothetical protein [Paraburkholderia phenoliruptrix]|uniref:Uncharacterized protein n=2 Tax=Paraburkholderia phenoliruptrix TaxID=252970 RepID=K0E3C4_9BURK|nr:hypothetical protein [Paraburkholderia phenoliruptrix]AFT90269.1 hypothetical protein BUPH_08277 [Paraburkholderia phenoliruptrix BR3459a]CAB4051688.1 hypothetical protein LMG9964_05367 [Paraburkholderia phenoliruptrix]
MLPGGSRKMNVAAKLGDRAGQTPIQSDMVSQAIAAMNPDRDHRGDARSLFPARYQDLASITNHAHELPGAVGLSRSSNRDSINKATMSDGTLFTAGNDGLVPEGDAARQAVDALRGYAYQVTASALAWLDLDKDGRLFLEVAEDYAVVAREAIRAVQVRDTEVSGSITLNTAGVREAITSFVSLTHGNPEAEVQLRYFTTSRIGTERSTDDRPAGLAGLVYWRKAATGADVAPLRSILEGENFASAVQEFVRARDDESLRRDLLRRIHWDCGKPHLTELRKELEERLVLVGRDVFKLRAPEARRLADVLIFRVLEKSIARKPADRVLTRASLYAAVDAASSMYVSRAAAEMMIQVASDLATSALAGQGTGVHVATSEPGWIVDGSALPSGRRMVNRTSIGADVAQQIRRSGASFIVGATGLGKSSVARTVARDLADRFMVVDFRDADALETRNRLDALLPRVGNFRAQTVILEDLNAFDDARVASSVALLLEALRRRDLAVIVTCYLPPTARSLSNAGLDAGCHVDCPYFAEEETAALVSLYGGDPLIWGRLAHASGGFGHPQLVNAFASGMSARGWPAHEIRNVVASGLSSGDVEAERESARRALVSALPDNSRDLLYRLSLTIGRFDRTMALAVASVPPPIARAGEYLDALVGPWLETVGRHQYRVSPLAARCGEEALIAAEQTGIHHEIATQLTTGGKIDAGDADAIIMHALSGKNAGVLAMISHSILSADEHTLRFLADNLQTFRVLRTDGPLFPKRPRLSSMLRLAQFKVLASTGDYERAAACVAALLPEITHHSDDGADRAFQVAGLGVVLGTMSIADCVDNWVDLLLAYEETVNDDADLRALRCGYEERGERFADLVAMLFAIGTTGISSVARLEFVIGQLDDMDPGRRSHWLLGMTGMAPDWIVFVSGPWTLERQHGVLDADDAAERYLRMALATASWGVPALSAQCWIARAVMFDEYLDDSEGALRALDEAVQALGESVALARARARVYWRRQDHPRSLDILRHIAEEVGRDNPVERATALREAAISAAHCDEWALAETWFMEGAQAAAVSESPDMAVMMIGLGADAAVAALHAVALERALSGLRNALTALAGIDPASSLRATYCHHVVRHAVLWAQSWVDRRRVEFEGAPISVAPGCCSNPEPPSAIAQRTLGAMDIAWYLLAETETSAGVNAGVADSLYGRLTGGPIPVLEVGLRARRLTQDMAVLDAGSFAGHLWGYVEAMMYLAHNRDETVTRFDPAQPVRGAIPALPRSDASLPVVDAIVKDAVFAYGIRAACSHASDLLSGLRTSLDAQLNAGVAQTALARACATIELLPASTFDDALIDAIRCFRTGGQPSPATYCWAGIQFFIQAGRSNFGRYLTGVIAAWQRKAWTRIIDSQRFRLAQVSKTLPRIRGALSLAEDDERFLATLFLAAADATSMDLPAEMVEQFRRVAEPQSGAAAGG